MKPGITIFPVQSTTSASASIDCWIAEILPSSTSTSATSRSPTSGSIEMTVPPFSRVLLIRVPLSREIGGDSVGMALATSGSRVQVRLAVPYGRKRPVHGPVAAARDEQVLGRELGDDLAAVGGHHDFLLDPRGRPAVGARPVGLEREDHPLLEHLRVLQRDQPAEDGLLPDGQADPVAVLQREGCLLRGEAELLR